MSFDHKPENPIESARIQLAGGYVAGNRVNGDLAVSRALGDFSFKDRIDLPVNEQKVIAVPDIVVMNQYAELDEFIIVATDGLFDVYRNEELVCDVRERLISGRYTFEDGSVNLVEIAQNLCGDAIFRRGSKDNVSISIILLPGAKIGEYIKKEEIIPTPLVES